VIGTGGMGKGDKCGYGCYAWCWGLCINMGGCIGKIPGLEWRWHSVCIAFAASGQMSWTRKIFAQTVRMYTI